MTAQIAILNRKGIALASDSAVTIGNGQKEKAFNTADKLFELSNRNPVAIMLYSNAEFIGVPWEILIKEYRKTIMNKSFDYVEQYCEDFFSYLKTYEIFKEIDSSPTIMRIAEYHLNTVLEITNEYINDISKQVIIDGNVVRENLMIALREYNKMIMNQGVNKNLGSVVSKDKLGKYNDNITQVIRRSIDYEEVKLSEIEENEILQVIKSAISSNVYSDATTGIVISGFGELEIFPRLYEYEIELIVDGNLKFKEIRRCEISNMNSEDKYTAVIIPFAQTDMAETFFRGINPNFKSIILRASDVFSQGLYEKYKFILEHSGVDVPVLTDEQRKGLDILGASMHNSLEAYIDETEGYNYISPFISIIGNLDKQELAEMAENLINLTSLSRKMSMDTETVGGPVDVAVISKGDGFIWTKRKHYFSRELNPNYSKMKGR